ncbi:MAG: YbaB/EbfC family nucleoid-associated protein [Chloroflexota bacterium]|nr:YbaB/EbfC family nucleoid-associated protein [Chloroflexota bacterium]
MARKGRSQFRRPQPGDMMKRLQELQDQMAEAQSSLEEEVVEASVGGGAVTVRMTGAQELRSIAIKPEVVDPDDVEMLQDLILAAFKEAQEKSQKLAAEKLGPLAGGVDIPGLT